MPRRLFLIVLDSLGIGAMPDAAKYGDEGRNTLAAIAASERFFVPNLQALGLFNIEGVSSASAVSDPYASFARAGLRSKGKSSLIGHWELAGVVSNLTLPTFPEGLSLEMLDELYGRIHQRFLCNTPARDEEVLQTFARPHFRHGAPILYITDQSVVNVIAEETVMPFKELCAICDEMHAILRKHDWNSRVIARSFQGYPPNLEFLPNRYECCPLPPDIHLLDLLHKRWMEVVAAGNIYDHFSGQGVTRNIRSKTNVETMDALIGLAKQNFSGLCYANLHDLDICAHKGDVDACAATLSLFDQRLRQLIQYLGPEDAVIVTSDHGCDPSVPPYAHSREYVPMLIFGDQICPGANLGTLDSLADIAATVQDFFELPVQTSGTSFLGEVLLKSSQSG